MAGQETVLLSSLLLTLLQVLVFATFFPEPLRHDQVVSRWLSRIREDVLRATTGTVPCVECLISKVQPTHGVFKICNGSVFFANSASVVQSQYKGHYELYIASTAISLLRVARNRATPCIHIVVFFGDDCSALLSDTALLRQKRDPMRTFPVFSYHTTRLTGSSLSCQGVVPFPSFDWYWFNSGNLLDLSQTLHPLPWSRKHRKVIWRGTCHGSRTRLMSGFGLRQELAHMSHNHTDLLDIKVTGACEGCVGRNTYNHLSLMEVCNYKYMLDVDGYGSTFRLKTLLHCGSLLFKVDSLSSQFFYDDLVPWVHFVPVSASNFEDDLLLKLRWALNNDERASQIAANSRKFASTYLNYDMVARYQGQVLAEYHPWYLKYAPAFTALNYSLFVCNKTTTTRRPLLKRLCLEALNGMFSTKKHT